MGVRGSWSAIGWGNGGDWDLVRCIVGMNAKLENRERSL